MKQNSFIWADLSSYEPKDMKLFYETIFGWKFHNDLGSEIAYKDNKQVVGLYQIP